MKIEKLTPEQEADIIVTRDKWLDRFFSCKNFLQKEKAKKGIEWLYEMSGFAKPEVVFVDSPYACQVVANREMKKINNEDPNSPMTYYQTASYCNVSDYGWVAWEDFFIRHELITLDPKVLENFNSFKELLLSGVYDMIQFDKMCIVSDMPTKIFRNNGRLHNPASYAVEFKDGWGQHYINGRLIPEDIFKKAVTLTKKQFLSEKNSDYKGAWYEILGQQNMMELLGAKAIDTSVVTHRNGDLETLTLFKTKETFEEIDNQPFVWLKMVCPTTGTNYLQGVEPTHTNALEAAASISLFSKDEYSFDMRS